jgi:hypothetical protein
MAAGGVRARPGSTGAEDRAAPTPHAPATFVFAETGGDSFWRAVAPAKVLGAKTIAVPPRLMERAFTRPNQSTPLPWRIEAATIDGQRHTFPTMKAWKQFTASRPSIVLTSMRSVFPTVEGTVVWQRPDMARAALSLAMQDQGIRTVGETDDNYFATPNQNPFLRHVRFSDHERLQHARAFACQDALVFSTAQLRDIYRREIRSRLGKKHLPDMHVCRNHVPAADWPERAAHDGPLRVGFMGSLSHVWDISSLGYATFHAAHGLGCETVFIGYNPADPDANTNGWDPGEEWRSEKSRYVSGRWKQVVSTHIPWVAPADYHRAGLPLDIGIAPLRTDSFTLGKSDSKAVEYAISGVAAVLQNNSVYNTAGWVHEQNCLMASTQEDFAHAVVRLIRDRRLRYELVSAAQEYVANERSDAAIREEWGAALS